jgi:hypothetical protein
MLRRGRAVDDLARGGRRGSVSDPAFAATSKAQDPLRRELIAKVLDELSRLSDGVPIGEDHPDPAVRPD